MSTRQDVSWGILGTGSIARQFAQAVVSTPGARLTGVGSRSTDRAAAFVAELGSETTAFGRYADLAASEPDIVYIATPHHRHAEDAHVMLDAGAHVLIEKPLALASADVRSVSAHAAAVDRIALEAMWTYFNPLVEEFLTRVRRGAFGTMRSMFGVCGPFGVPHGHRALDPQLGGSFLWECLVYPLSMLTAVDSSFHHPDRVHAALHTSGKVDDSAAVILTNGSRFAQFGGAIREGAADAARSQLQFVFDQAWVEFDVPYNPSVIRIGWVDGGVERLEAPAAEIGLGYEVAAVTAAVRDDRPLPDYARIDTTARNASLLERITAGASMLSSPAPASAPLSSEQAPSRPTPTSPR